MNQDLIADLLFAENRKREAHVFGVVEAVNADGSYQVRISSESTARAVACCAAQAGDRVLVLLMKTGRCVCLAKVLSV